MDNKKIKIAFLAPETKWWPYYIYKDIVEALKSDFWNKLDVYFYNSKKDWVKLHFKKIDFIFSVIPFLFKPLWAKKYLYNLHWNYKIERKNKWLGVKLLYLSELNLFFSDNIMLTSYFLADKLWFREKYSDKIIINPIFVKNINNSKKVFNNINWTINLLTVSSTKFLDKGKWIIDIWKQLSKINDLNINWTIVAGWNDENKKNIFDEFNTIKFNSNIKVKSLDWVEKEALHKLYNDSDIFIYGTRLDTWWVTIMEAMSFWLPVILLEYELWDYIFPKEIVTDNIENRIRDVINNYEEYKKYSLSFINNYSYEIIINKLFNFLIKK